MGERTPWRLTINDELQLGVIGSGSFLRGWLGCWRMRRRVDANLGRILARARYGDIQQFLRGDEQGRFRSGSRVHYLQRMQIPCLVHLVGIDLARAADQIDAVERGIVEKIVGTASGRKAGDFSTGRRIHDNQSSRFTTREYKAAYLVVICQRHIIGGRG